jgi:hypothetical protein
MNCQVKDELVNQLIALNNKLNTLSPDLVHGDEERAEVQQRRESLYAEIKLHRAKGHEGKPCPAARQPTVGLITGASEQQGSRAACWINPGKRGNRRSRTQYPSYR